MVLLSALIRHSFFGKAHVATLGAVGVGVHSRANYPVDMKLFVSSFELPDILG